MIVYLYNDNNVYCGEWECQESPIKKGQYIVPSNSTTTKPQTPNSQFVSGKWVELPKVEEESPAPIPSPENDESVKEITVTPWQFRQALNETGYRAAVETLVHNTTDQDIKDGWEYASEWKEFHPVVTSMAEAIGVDQDELHKLFLLASSK